MIDKIVEILKEHEGWVDRSRTSTCVWPDDYTEIAEEIVKLFAIPIVVDTCDHDFIDCYNEFSSPIGRQCCKCGTWDESWTD